MLRDEWIFLLQPVISWKGNRWKLLRCGMLVSWVLFEFFLKCQEIIRNPVRFINKKLISNGVEVCFYEREVRS